METGDVEALNIRDQEFTEIPPNMKNFIPNLKAILLYKVNLRTISPDDLPFPMLEYFSSMFNKIHAIDGELFKNTPKLKVISFYSNLLEHVGDDIFKGLTDLKQVDFSANRCVDFMASTAEEIERLSEFVLVECKCSYRCSLGDEVDELNLIADELSKKAKELIEKNLSQDKIESDLKKLAEESSEKIAALETIVKELESMQCGSTDINLTSIMKIIFIAFTAILLIIVLIVIVMISVRKFQTKQDKPMFGPNH